MSVNTRPATHLDIHSTKNQTSIWIFCIFYFPVFITGANLTLPLAISTGVPMQFPEVQVPFWAQRIVLFKYILLQEILFFLAMLTCVFVSIRNRYKLRLPRRVNVIAICLLLLGILVIFNAIVYSPFTEHDIGRGARLLFNAACLFLLVQWPYAGGTLLLRVFFYGLLIGCLINVFYSFVFIEAVDPNYIIYFAINIFSMHIPKLLGQNNCGPGLALLIVLIYESRKNIFNKEIFDTVSHFFVRVVATIVLVMSWSKVAIITAVLCASWEFKKFVCRSRYRLVVFTSFFIIVTFTMVLYFLSPEGQIFIWNHVDPVFNISGNIQERLVYHIGVFEIAINNPFGVGITGFQQHFLGTDIFQHGELIVPQEFGVPESESNPHSTFLYYFSSNGILGLGLVLLLFYQALKLFYELYLKPTGRVSTFFITVIFFFATFASVPYGLNSLILFLPLASLTHLNPNEVSGYSTRSDLSFQEKKPR
jgi:hypothetical protein